MRIFTIFAFFLYPSTHFFHHLRKVACLLEVFVLLRRFSHRFLFADVRTISEIYRVRFRLCFSLPSAKSFESLVLILPQICVHVRGERVHVSRRGGRGLRFFLSRRLPSPLPFSLFPFRPSYLGLFGAPLQTPAPETNEECTHKKFIILRDEP